MAKPPKDESEVDQAEADRRRDEALKRALNMPPKHRPAKKAPKPGTS
jgi:hypothetical protein